MASNEQGQKHLAQLPKNRLVRIYPDPAQKPTGKLTPPVIAHLPETFGYGVGAEITAPFASFISESNTVNILRATGISNKTGLMTTKIYAGPDQPDITVDLKFDAYYDAYNEVVVPVVNLLKMASGADETALSEQQVRSTFGEGLVDAIGENVNDALVKIAQIHYLQAPSKLTVMFGNVFRLESCYIVNVDPRFSNLLDYNGYPMEATVSVTFSLIKPMVYQDISRSFTRKL